MQLYRVYYLKCNATGKIFVGMRSCFTEEETTELTVFAAIRYIMNKNKQSSMYNKFALHYNSPQTGDSNSKKVSNFSILFDKELFEDKETAYTHLVSKQNKILETGDNLLNDFIMDNEKILCKCGFSVRKMFYEQHLEKYCKSKKKEALYLEI